MEIKKKPQLKKNPAPSKTSIIKAGNSILLYPAAFILLLFIIFFLYQKTLSYPIDKLDEEVIIPNCIAYNNSPHTFFQLLTQDASFGGHSDVFFYRPMQNLSYIADIHLFGSSATGFRTSGIILFTLLCFLFLYLLVLFGVRFIYAFLLSLLVSCHPLFSLSVVWLPSRGDLLSTLFSILSLILFMHYLKKANILLLIFTVLSVALAVFSKESVIALPLVFIIILYLKDRKALKSGRNILIILLSALASISYILVRMALSSAYKGAPGTFSLMNLFLNLRTIPEGLAKLFIPVHLSPMPIFMPDLLIIGLVSGGLLLFLSIRLYKSSPYLALGLLWFLLFLAPTLFFRHGLSEFSYNYLEHRLLLPSLGLLSGCGILLNKLPLKWDKYMILFMLVACAGLSGYTLHYNNTYRSSFTYYSRVLEVNPGDILAHQNLAGNLEKNKEYQEAIQHHTAILSRDPKNLIALLNRARNYVFLNQPEKAIPDLTAAIAIRNDYSLGYYMRGVCHNMLRQYDMAVSDFDLALKVQPDYTDALVNKGSALEGLKQPDKALECYMKAVSINPELPEANNNIGLLLHNKQQYSEAIKYFSAAINARPSYWDVFLNRGNSYLELRDYKRAYEDYDTFLSNNPSNSNVLNNLGILKVNLGLMDEACNFFRRAAGLGNAIAANNLKTYCR